MSTAILGKNCPLRTRGKPAKNAAPDFKTMLGTQAWSRLHPAVQRRFSNHNLRVCYPGEMTVRDTFIGKFFALLTLPFGRPLPIAKLRHYKARVEVFPDTSGGVVWRRDFLRADKTPLRIESVKQLGVDGNLLECVRSGPLGAVGMGLKIYEDMGGLCFESLYYFLALGRLRIPMPNFLTPGTTLVRHDDEGGGKFRFSLTMTHKYFGVTIHQEGLFEDPFGGEG